MTNAPRSSKNERRDAAREKARQERIRQQRRERRNRVVLQASIGVVIIAIVAVVAVIIVNSVRPPGPGPKNMANGGITIQGANLSVLTTPAASAGATPTAQPTVGGGKVLIQIYEDFGCPYCQAFEQTYGAQVKQLITSGAAVVQYHPISILDTHFTDLNYSTRAAIAAAAIANYSPNAFYKFHSILYESSVQPKEGASGLTNARLIALAKQAGATHMSDIENAINNETFKNWVADRSDEFVAGTGSLSGVNIPSAQRASTPTIVVNGQYWDSTKTANFGSFVTQVGGAIASSTPTPTPTPTPTASATPSPSATASN